MIEYLTNPWWVYLLAVIPFVLALVVGLIEYAIAGYVKIQGPAIAMLLFVFGILASGVLILSMPFAEKETFNNPVAFEKMDYRTSSFNVNTNDEFLRDLISKEAGIDGLNFKENGYLSIINLRSGSSVDFSGFKEKSKIEGSVYFTEDSMVIIVSDENNINDKIEVPVE